MIVSIVWKVVGFGMLLFVAAIQAIPQEIDEAAMVDGAGYWQRVRRITLPLTARTMLLVTLFSVIGSLLAFDQFFLMTAGQPFNQTASSVFWIYLNSFPYLKLGYGAALSLILAVIILACTVVQMMLTRRSPRLMPRRGSNGERRIRSHDRPERGELAQRRGTRLGRAAPNISLGAICIALCVDHAGAAGPLGPGIAEDHHGGGGGPADLLPARAQPRQLRRLWNYQAGLPTYLFNSAGDGVPDDRLLPRR